MFIDDHAVAESELFQQDRGNHQCLIGDIGSPAKHPRHAKVPQPHQQAERSSRIVHDLILFHRFS